MKKIKIMASVSALLLAGGCSDYLDVVPDNIPTIEIVFMNNASAEQYLYTRYWFMPEAGKIGTDPGLSVGDAV